jgi:hypothetical protein
MEKCPKKTFFLIVEFIICDTHHNRGVSFDHRAFYRLYGSHHGDFHIYYLDIYRDYQIDHPCVDGLLVDSMEVDHFELWQLWEALLFSAVVSL